MLTIVPFLPSAASTSALTRFFVAAPPGHATTRKSDSAASVFEIGHEAVGRRPAAACARCTRSSCPSPQARCAIALPMRPSPRMPTVLPPSLVVSSGPRFFHSPACAKRLSRHEAASGHQDQADGDVGDVVGQHVRRVGHLDAALAAIVDRHAVVADAEHRDDLELRQRVEQRRRRHRAAALHEAADARALRGEQPGLVRSTGGSRGSDSRAFSGS